MVRKTGFSLCNQSNTCRFLQPDQCLCVCSLNSIANFDRVAIIFYAYRLVWSPNEPVSIKDDSFGRTWLETQKTAFLCRV